MRCKALCYASTAVLALLLVAYWRRGEYNSYLPAWARREHCETFRGAFGRSPEMRKCIIGPGGMAFGFNACAYV